MTLFVLKFLFWLVCFNTLVKALLLSSVPYPRTSKVDRWMDVVDMLFGIAVALSLHALLWI